MPSSTIYKMGSVSITSGTNTVTGVGTGFSVNGVKGGLFCVSGYSIPISDVVSDTELTLAFNYNGTTIASEADDWSISLETAQAADAAFTHSKLVDIINNLAVSGVIPDASGTLTERDAATRPIDYIWLRVEVGEELELYINKTGGWLGPYPLQGAQGAPGLGAGGTGLPTGGTSGQLLAKLSGTYGDAAWSTLYTVPGGGTTGQVLAKTSGTDGATAWRAALELPTGGTAGQLLTKTSGTDGAASWSTLYTVPTGGTTGQVLAKTSGTDGATAWETVIGLPAAGAAGQMLYKSSGTDGDADWINIVGTVGFSTVPTGAIIETGTGTNGRYIKYADGTMICYGTADLGNIDVNVSFGGWFINNFVNFTLPATFVGQPIITGCTHATTASAGIVHSMTVGVNSATASVMFSRGVSGTAIATLVNFNVIGRWRT